MQIQNNTTPTNIKAAEQPLDLKKGDIVSAKIKEWKQNGDVTLLIKGKEVPAKLEGKAPTSDRVTVEVTGEKDGLVTVKEKASTATTDKQAPSVLTGKESKEVKQAVTTLQDKGIAVTKETVQEIKSFFDKAQGTPEQKLASLEALVNKGLEVTRAQLHGVHEALHGGRQLAETVDSFQRMDKRMLEQVVRDLASQLREGASLDRVRDSLQTIITKADPEVSQALQKLAQEVAKLIQAGKADIAKQWMLQSLTVMSNEEEIDVLMKQVLSQVDEPERQPAPKHPIEVLEKALPKEANVQKAIELVREQVGSARLSEGLTGKIEEALHRATTFGEQGREMKARQELAGIMTMIKEEAGIQDQASSIYKANEAMQTSVQLTTKDYVVRHVSQSLAEATAAFREVKREVTRSLDQLNRLLELQHRAKPQARQMLETTIKQLDNAIIKSDIMLFADMKTEKQLLQSSSELANAKKMLEKGDFTGASKIVQDVKGTLEKINFQPADIKVKRFITSELALQESKTAEQKAANLLMDITRPEKSAKQVFEALRSLGLQHESQLAQRLVQGDPQQQERNMKALLLQMMQEDAGKSGQRLEHALNNLNGQQLLSKSDGSSLQNMLFNLPILLQDKVENLQVFVQSKNKGEKVDWENASIYFLIETKRLGDVGILVTTTDRKLSITIKNDKEQLKEKMEPLANVTKEKLNEIGYAVSGITFAKMNAEKQTIKQESKPVAPIMTEKGMDFKI